MATTVTRFLAVLAVVTTAVSKAAAAAYVDEELVCPPGHSIAALNRGAAALNEPLTGSCRPMVSGGLKLNDSKCERRAPLRCDKNGDSEVCREGEWLGGLISYQLKTTRANLLIPICCHSDSVQLPINTTAVASSNESSSSSSCESLRLNGFLEPIKYRVAPGRVINGIRCQYLADRKKNILDMFVHILVCPYRVSDAIELHRANVTIRSGHGQRLEDADRSAGVNETSTTVQPASCPPCQCLQCTTGDCPKGKKVVRRQAPIKSDRGSGDRCACDCFCEFKCDDA